MIRYKSIQQQTIENLQTTRALNAAQEQLMADLDFIAMMCDVELSREEEDDEQV